MRRALELARSHRPHPNPRVGAVVIGPGGEILGEGAHAAVGKPHAEVLALEAAGGASKGSTLYVTLEPCTHRGNTPPCVDAIVAAGVAKVLVGVEDPDSRIAGAGISALREAGIEVVAEFMAEEAEAVDPAYFHHRRTGMPRVTLKYAMTLDGSIAAADGSSRWISSEVAREDAHRLRAEMDAVVVGSGTLRGDDPRLTVRLEGFAGPQPVPIVIAGSGDLPAQAVIWERSPMVVATSRRRIPSGELVVVAGSDGHPDPVAAARAIADRGHLDVLLEGGAALAGAWWRAGVVNRGVVYLTAKLGGGRGISPLDGVFSTMGQAAEVLITDVRSLDGDYRIDYERV